MDNHLDNKVDSPPTPASASSRLAHLDQTARPTPANCSRSPSSELRRFRAIRPALGQTTATGNTLRAKSFCTWPTARPTTFSRSSSTATRSSTQYRARTGGAAGWAGRTLTATAPCRPRHRRDQRHADRRRGQDRRRGDDDGRSQEPDRGRPAGLQRPGQRQFAVSRAFGRARKLRRQDPDRLRGLRRR